MIRTIFINGEIEFYPSDRLEYDTKYSKSDKNGLVFLNYRDKFGTTNDSVIEAYNSSISGKLRVPGFFHVKECIDLQVSPHLNLSVRSAEQGLVNEKLMEPLTPRYKYGDSLTDIMKKIFKTKSLEFFFDTEKKNFNIYHDNKYTVMSFQEFCYKNNLVYIDSFRAPIITTGYSVEDISLADNKMLDFLEKYFVSREEYENAERVVERLKLLKTSVSKLNFK